MWKQGGAPRRCHVNNSGDLESVSTRSISTWAYALLFRFRSWKLSKSTTDIQGLEYGTALVVYSVEHGKGGARTFSHVERCAIIRKLLDSISNILQRIMLRWEILNTQNFSALRVSAYTRYSVIRRVGIQQTLYVLAALKQLWRPVPNHLSLIGWLLDELVRTEDIRSLYRPTIETEHYVIFLHSSFPTF